MLIHWTLRIQFPELYIAKPRRDSVVSLNSETQPDHTSGENRLGKLKSTVIGWTPVGLFSEFKYASPSDSEKLSQYHYDER